MKTICIWDTCGQEPLKYFVVEGDQSHLDGTYINLDGDEDRQDELNKLTWDEEKDESTVEFLDAFPKELFSQFPNEGIEVIAVGFLP